MIYYYVRKGIVGYTNTITDNTFWSAHPVCLSVRYINYIFINTANTSILIFLCEAWLFLWRMLIDVLHLCCTYFANMEYEIRKYLHTSNLNQICTCFDVLYYMYVILFKLSNHMHTENQHKHTYKTNFKTHLNIIIFKKMHTIQIHTILYRIQNVKNNQ